MQKNWSPVWLVPPQEAKITELAVQYTASGGWGRGDGMEKKKKKLKGQSSRYQRSLRTVV